MSLCALLYRHLLTRAVSFLVFLQYHLPIHFLPRMDPAKPNPNPNPDPIDDLPGGEEVVVGEEEAVAAAAAESEQPETTASARPARTPFTDLSQVDADLALARTLQEQERAYMMLRMGSADDGGFEGSETGSEYELHYDGDGDDFHLGAIGSADGSDYDEEEEDEDEDAFDAQEHEVEIDPSAYNDEEEEEEDAFDAQEHEVEIDQSAYNDDEAYARALQEAEERRLAARLMALTGISDWTVDDRDDRGSNAQGTWQDVDPDEFSYEELVALGEAVGTESRGLSADVISSLTSISYESKSAEEDETHQCVICRLDYEDGDSLIVLSCKHTYHTECINKWLQINKACPVCNTEVSSTASTQS